MRSDLELLEIMTNNKQFIPLPEDLSGVELPSELSELAEFIAKNVHEVWAHNRKKEGWRYGPVRDDEKKTHPCLVPYEELPEAEKDYDRATSQETLKLIMRLGFSISKN